MLHQTIKVKCKIIFLFVWRKKGGVLFSDLRQQPCPWLRTHSRAREDIQCRPQVFTWKVTNITEQKERFTPCPYSQLHTASQSHSKEAVMPQKGCFRKVWLVLGASCSFLLWDCLSLCFQAWWPLWPSEFESWQQLPPHTAAELPPNYPTTPPKHYIHHVFRKQAITSRRSPWNHHSTFTEPPTLHVFHRNQPTAPPECSPDPLSTSSQHPLYPTPPSSYNRYPCSTSGTF